MKLITEFYDVSEAEDTSNRMRQAGVMTIVTSKKLHTLSRVKTGAFKIGLWAVLDEQYQDARRLLKDHNHIPNRILSFSEMDEIQAVAIAKTNKNLNKFIQTAATWIFGGILLALLAYVAIGLINDA